VRLREREGRYAGISGIPGRPSRSRSAVAWTAVFDVVVPGRWSSVLGAAPGEPCPSHDLKRSKRMELAQTSDAGVVSVVQKVLAARMLNARAVAPLQRAGTRGPRWVAGPTALGAPASCA
jgi:hypothetical protein